MIGETKPTAKMRFLVPLFVFLAVAAFPAGKSLKSSYFDWILKCFDGGWEVTFFKIVNLTTYTLNDFRSSVAYVFILPDMFVMTRSSLCISGICSKRGKSCSAW